MGESYDNLTVKLFIFCLCINIMECSVTRLSFSESIAKHLIFKRIVNISVDKCSDECKARPLCKQMLYHRAPKVCSLTKEADSTEIYADKRGVVMKGFDAIRLVNDQCGGNVCNERETCVTDNNVPSCKVSECAMVDSPYYTIHGNMFAINSTLHMINGKGEHSRITCGDDGFWIGGNSHGCCEAGCTSGVVIWPSNLDLYYCEMDSDGGHWVVFQRRVNGSTNFYRNWEAYRAGFGHFNVEFWLGLQTMYSILSTGEFELRVDMVDFENETRYAKYSTFSINGPSDNYRLNVDGYSGDAGDSLSYHSGKQFSTYDNDNDMFNRSCATIYRGGWWYGSCHHSNLNGIYFNSGENTTIYAKGIHWRTWHGYFISLKFCEMKFRRKP